MHGQPITAVEYLRNHPLVRYDGRLYSIQDVTSFFLAESLIISPDFSNHRWSEAGKQFPYLPDSRDTHATHISKAFLMHWDMWQKSHGSPHKDIIARAKEKAVSTVYGRRLTVHADRMDFFCCISAPEM